MLLYRCLLLLCMEDECSVWCCRFFFFFKQKTAYEMRISDWSSDVCSSDLPGRRLRPAPVDPRQRRGRKPERRRGHRRVAGAVGSSQMTHGDPVRTGSREAALLPFTGEGGAQRRMRARAQQAALALRAEAEIQGSASRSEEHTSELQSLMRHSS